MNSHLPMGRIDFAPLAKFSVGFDNIFESMQRLYDTQSGQTNYPPYDIIKCTDDNYIIAFAVAGLDSNNISITVENNILSIAGDKKEDTVAVEYLHRGISNRSFKRKFTLDDHLEVGEAVVNNGILTISICRSSPPVSTARKIAISTNK